MSCVNTTSSSCADALSAILADRHATCSTCTRLRGAVCVEHISPHSLVVFRLMFFPTPVRSFVIHMPDSSLQAGEEHNCNTGHPVPCSGPCSCRALCATR